VLPSVSVCSPVTATVRRRNSRTGVLSRRWAALSRQQPAATDTPAGVTDSVWAKYPVKAGKPPHASANQRSLWKRPERDVAQVPDGVRRMQQRQHVSPTAARQRVERRPIELRTLAGHRARRTSPRRRRSSSGAASRL
jgi:hypothetical protein